MRIPYTNIEIKRSQSKKPVEQPKLEGLSYGSSFFMSPQDTIGSSPIDLATYYWMFDNQPDVSAAIREVTTYVGTNGYVIESPDGEIVEIDELKDVLNCRTTEEYLFDEIVEDLMISGNCYIEIGRSELGSGNVNALGVLDPRTVTVVADKTGVVYRYIQTVGPNKKMFEPEQIIHIKLRKQRTRPWFGRSPLQAVSYDIRTDIEAMKTSYYTFKNRGIMSNLLILDQMPTESELKNVTAQLQKAFGGSENANKTGIVPGLKDVKQIAQDLVSLQLLEGRKFGTNKICSALGVPPVLLGYTEGVNFSNHDGQMAKYVEYTIRPIERLIASAIARQLLPILGYEGYTMSFNEVSFEDIDQKHLRVREGVKVGLFTINEGRKMLGMEEAEGVLGEVADQHILHNGASAVLIEDVGVDPVVDFSNEDQAEKAINLLKEFKNSAYVNGQGS